MEEEIRAQHQEHYPLPTPLTTTTTTKIATTASPRRGDKVSPHLPQEVSLSTGGAASHSTMGGNRSGSTSSSVGWMGEGGEGNNGSSGRSTSSSSSSSTTTTTTVTTTSTSTSSGSRIQTPTTPRQSSNRDSGYHTDFSFSPATFTSQPQFTFDTPTFPSTLCDPPLGSSSSSPSRDQGSLQPGCSYVEQGSPMGSTSPPPPLPPPRSSLAVAPGWQPRRVLPDVDSDDEGDDDAFVSDNVTIGATSHLPGLHVIPSREVMQRESRALTSRDRRRSADKDRDDQDNENGDDDDDRRGESRLRGEEEEERPRERTRDRSCSPRTVSLPGLRHPMVAADEKVCSDDDDGDDDDDDVGEQEGVSRTDYHHAPLSLVTLPGGERIRPLLARTIATQTPHLHCQLIDQLLDCPQDFPQMARGSAVRRLRYYSEGEESVGVSTLTRGPLPDLVPVTQGHRERSLSAPDLESLQRQRMAAREVGRELRRISDEFVRNHEALRDHRHHQNHGALVALHAELNGAAAFFLTGVRRFLYRGFAGYFRHVFHWTRQAMAASRTQQTRPRRDSSVDQQR